VKKDQKGAAGKEPTAATLRALVLGAAGSAVLTASSLYIALKMGALPWPIVFATLVSVVALRALGSRRLNEANVCHAAMSAGSMIAGGLAFTIPGLWMLGETSLDLGQLMLATAAGTVLGLIASKTLQPYFIRRQRLAYPIGQAAADTLRAFDTASGKERTSLFSAMGLSAVYAFVRDNLGALPTIWTAGTTGTGVVLGIYNSPMMLAVGFVVGVVPCLVWAVGGLVGNLGIATLLPALGVLEAGEAASVQSSAGLGLMLGTGAGAIVASLVPELARAWRGRRGRAGAHAATGAGAGTTATTSGNAIAGAHTASKSVAMAHAAARAQDEAATLAPQPRLIALCVATAACILCAGLQLPLLVSAIIIVAAWFCVWLSSWLTGTTGINPMEIFGVLVLLLVQVVAHELSLTSLFLVAAIIAVAAGICGDCMNDLKAGDVLGTPARDQFKGEVVGAIVGAIVAPLMLMALLHTYGAEAFGAGQTFVAAQASVVASMAGGIPYLEVFIGAAVLGFFLALCKLPVMTLGLGLYLPLYMSIAAAAGAALRAVVTALAKRKGAGAAASIENVAQAGASGILGGESLVGVVTALAAFIGSL
jgi:putative OPT family oligopeptide transporter